MALRYESIRNAINRAFALIDYNTHNNITKRHEFLQKTILNDKALTKDEKSEAIKKLVEDYDYDKVLLNEGTKRICENCKKECLATLYCEHCIREYLEAKFTNWTSGNDSIDDLIRDCQLQSLLPSKIIEWIPYQNLQNIKYLTKGGCSEIYLADWTDGHYLEWDSKKMELKRLGTCKVILKNLVNVESADRSWFDEVNDLKLIIMYLSFFLSF